MSKKNDGVRWYPTSYISALARQVLKEELRNPKLEWEKMELLKLLKTLHSVSVQQELNLRKLEALDVNNFDQWAHFELVEEIMVIGNSGR